MGNNFTAELYEKVPPHVVLGDLLGAEIKPRGETAVRCVNAAAHQRGDRNPSLDVNGGSGLFNCLPCGFNGDAVRLKAFLDGSTDVEAIARLRERYNLPRVNGNGVAVHATPSAITTGGTSTFPYFPATAERVGWTWTTVRHNGADVPALQHPIYDERFQQVGWKLRGPRDESGKIIARIRGINGNEKAAALGLCGDVLALRDRKPGDLVLMVSGETDYLSTRHAMLKDGLDVPLVFHSNGETDAGKLGPRAKLLAPFTTAIVYDEDDAGVQGAEARVAEVHGAGGRAAHVRLPLTDEQRGRKKVDVRDWLAEGGSLRALLGIAEHAFAPREDPWEEPVPLDVTDDLPEFPVDALPHVFARWVAAEAEATQTPTDVAALAVLAVLATAAARKFRVEVREGWEEPVNLYLVGALPSGNRKSAVFDAATAPVTEYEKAERDARAEEFRRQENAYFVAQHRLKKARERAASADVGDRAQAMAELDAASDDAARQPRPAELRLLARDVTIERLPTMLEEQGGRLAILSAEGGIFGTLGGRWAKSGGANLDPFKMAHSGESLIVNRVGRRGDFVRSPALTLGLIIQNDTVRRLADNPEFRGEGLLARILWSLPRSTVGKRNLRPAPMPHTVASAYRAAVLWILNRPEDRDEEGQIKAEILFVDRAAEEALNRFAEEFEPRLARGADLYDIADWACKLAGAVARIAALLHVAEAAATSTRSDPGIYARTMEQAVRIGRYFLAHAQAAFRLIGQAEAVADAQTILAWIEREQRTEFTPRDACRGASFREMAPVEAALKHLVAHGYVRREPVPSGARGGRPTVRYRVNPAVAGGSVGFVAMSQGSSSGRDGGGR